MSPVARPTAAFFDLDKTIIAKSSTLDPVLRELVRIKIAGLNACQY